MVTSKVGKRYAFTGFDALKELFLMRLAPYVPSEIYHALQLITILIHVLCTVPFH
jgi:hypothetical protein